MLDKELREQILESIANSGKIDEPEIKLNTNINDVLSFSSGSPRLQQTVLRKSKMILSKPDSLMLFSSLQIRCVLCKRVISYPCWYYEVKYAVNHFHYFICFSATRSDKPTTQCYKNY